MKRSFFARHALLVLAAVFFLVPFALRGARMSLQGMKNDVVDWLPKHFPETRELAWFARHFVGEQFIVMTWPGCTEDDPRFQLMVKKLQSEVKPPPHLSPAPPGEQAPEGESLAGGAAGSASGGGPPSSDNWMRGERERARELGDRLGLFVTGDFYVDWGGRQEKWLLGKGNSWYFITPKGELYHWRCDGNVLGYVARHIDRAKGRPLSNVELVNTIGRWDGASGGNEFYRDPHKLAGRLFNSVRTGPMVRDELAAPGGSLWPIGNVAEEDKPRLARQLAMERLTGSLFGPPAPYDFGWTVAEFLDFVPETYVKRLPTDWRETFDKFVDELVQQQYSGDRAALLSAPTPTQTKHWNALFARLGCPPPPRLTCVIVTLSDVGKQDIQRTVGRPLLGKPRGRLLELAADECGIAADDLRLGGPPVDNVAIDEEGTKTLFHLIVYSAIVGLLLAFICFRSVSVTLMIFFVGGVSAVTSLALVWWCGSKVDAIVMSMPALVYVLGLSGAVHIVNYYRDAVRETGLEGAPEKALAHGWFPCTLAAFTTALGLLSLYTSHIAPINRFGLFSALGVMATLLLLFTFMPAAMQLYPPRYHREKGGEAGRFNAALARLVKRFWAGVGEWVIRRHALVSLTTVLILAVAGAGLVKINTSIQLLKLFDKDAKLIHDYTWLERHLGKLVPMELVLCVEPEYLRPPLDQLAKADAQKSLLQFDMLERMEASARIRRTVEEVFGQDARDIIGRGIAADTFAPDLPRADAGGVLRLEAIKRLKFNSELERNRRRLLESDYVRDDQNNGNELWRISLRLGALNDVDYGAFVSELKCGVEPVLAGYRYRNKLLRTLSQQGDGAAFARSSVLLLGYDPASPAEPPAPAAPAAKRPPGADQAVLAQAAQTRVFADTMDELLRNRGFRRSRIDWHVPADAAAAGAERSEEWAKRLAAYDCVVLVQDHPALDLDFIREHARQLIDARDHRYDPSSPQSLTAAQRDSQGDADAGLYVVYTGLVPIVYKAQRALLNSLINSIGLAFVMIALIMMVLLRRWREPVRPSNLLNFSGGLTSMLPNVFPMVLIFGVMGHLGVLVDIGSMMTASVAMGVAVDDTIHFLSWFRTGIRQGLSRRDAIRMAYDRVATAMTQTTAIGGLGLFVFALSTFTPTQQFGILMLTLLAAALVGDLIMLPALLAGPLGRFFEPDRGEQGPDQRDAAATGLETSRRRETPHSGAKLPEAAATPLLRRDPGRKFGT